MSFCCKFWIDRNIDVSKRMCPCSRPRWDTCTGTQSTPHSDQILCNLTLDSNITFPSWAWRVTMSLAEFWCREAIPFNYRRGGRAMRSQAAAVEKEAERTATNKGTKLKCILRLTPHVCEGSLKPVCLRRSRITATSHRLIILFMGDNSFTQWSNNETDGI